MSTGLIIAIVVVALLLIALFAFLLPRMRRKAEVQKRERELSQRRERAAEEQRTEAAERHRQAEMAEQKARMAEAEAQRERAEAQLGEQRAQMHEQGMADHELIDEHERDRFAGTSAMRDDGTTTRDDEPAPMRDDRNVRADGTTTPAGTSGSGTTDAEGRPMHEPETEYQHGREDEAAMREGRFSRDDETARTDEPTTTRRDA
jgi:FtsZ-interacting cell division protein ZipA